MQDINFKKEVLEFLDNIEILITKQKYELILKDIKNFRKYIFAITKMEELIDKNN